MTRMTKQQMKEHFEAQMLQSEKIRLMQEKQIQDMMRLMQAFAQQNNLEVPEFVKQNVQQEVKVEEVVTTETPVANVEASTQETTKKVPAKKRVRKPAVRKAVKKVDEILTGSVIGDQPAIQMLSEAMTHAREVSVQNNFSQEPMTTTTASTASEVEQNAATNATTSIIGSNLAAAKEAPALEEVATQVNEATTYTEAKKVAQAPESDFFHKVGRFVGKALIVVSKVNISKFLEDNKQKNMSAYSEAEKAGFEEEVVYKTEENNSKVEAVEAAVQKATKDNNIKVSIFKRGLNTVMKFFTNDTTESGATAKAAKHAEELLDTAGILTQKNERRDAFLKALNIKDLTTFISTRTEKNIVDSGLRTEQQLLDEGYRKTSKGFVNNTLFSLIQDKLVGPDLVADYIRDNVFVDLRNKICGAMRLYCDVNAVASVDTDMNFVKEFIATNNMRCDPQDVIEQLSRDPESFNFGKIFGDKIVNPKFIEAADRIVKFSDDYFDKRSNIYAAMSTYIQAVETHKNIILNLEISDDKKAEIVAMFDNENNRFVLNKEKGHTVSFKQIADTVTEYMMQEIEEVKQARMAEEAAAQKETPSLGVEDTMAQLRSIEAELDAMENTTPAPKRKRASRAKPKPEAAKVETVNVEGEEKEPVAEKPVKVRKPRVKKSDVVATAQAVDANVTDVELKEKTSDTPTFEVSANEKVLKNAGNKAFLAKIKKEDTPQTGKSLSL